MSKIIKITQEHINKCIEEFKESLSSGKFPDGKINYTKTFDKIERKATINFTEEAWLKMQSLVMTCKKEVGWHGIAERGEEPDTYIISDILVYPQEVTGATVTPDQAEYEMWLMNHDDDVFNNIRMQGHSHVDFSVTPSGVDLNLYEKILEQLDDDMFYIFLIYNKRGDKTIKIYDLRENILFETLDVTVNVIKKEGGIMDFLERSLDLVVEKQTSYNKYAKSYGGYHPPTGFKKDDEKDKKETDYDKKNVSKSVTRLGKRTDVKEITDKQYGQRYGYGYDDYDDEERWTDSYYERMYGIR